MIKKTIVFNEKDNLNISLTQKENLKAKFGEKINGSSVSGDYEKLNNLPKINGETLKGDKTLVELGLLNNLSSGDSINIESKNNKVKISVITNYISLNDVVDGSTGQLTQEQGELLLASLRNYVLVNNKFYCKLKEYDSENNLAIYTCNYGDSYVSIQINTSTGEYIAYLKTIQADNDLIESGNGEPITQKQLGKLYENTKNGSLYQMANKVAGIYDEDNILIEEWDNLGIDETCSNAGEIISKYENARKVIVSSEIKEIASLGFNGAKQITKLYIPDSVETINNYAFNGTYALKEISLPFVGNNNGSTGSNHLFGIVFENGSNDNVYKNQQYYSSSTYIYTYTPKTLSKVIIRGTPSETSLNQQRSFDGMTGISEVVIANAYLIEPRMFLNMSSLTTLSVYAKENASFALGINALQNTNVVSLTLPKETTSVRNIESQLTELHLLSATPPTNPDRTRSENLKYIGVPLGCGDTYRNNENWSIYADIINEEDLTIESFNDELKGWVLIPNKDYVDYLYAKELNERELAISQLQSDIDNHTLNDNNPHETTFDLLKTKPNPIIKAEQEEGTSKITFTFYNGGTMVYVPTTSGVAWGNIIGDIDLQKDLKEKFYSINSSLSSEAQTRQRVDEKLSNAIETINNNKVDTITESSDNYPTCNAVIKYIASLDGDNDEF